MKLAKLKHTPFQIIICQHHDKVCYLLSTVDGSYHTLLKSYSVVYQTIFKLAKFNNYIIIQRINYHHSCQNIIILKYILSI